MPRVDTSREAGLHIAGVYEALLDLERDRNERDDRRAEPMEREQGYHFRRGRLLGKRLEAGESVVLLRAQVELALSLWEGQRTPLPSRTAESRHQSKLGVRAAGASGAGAVGYGGHRGAPPPGR
jgi:hypothetical protein